MLIWDPVDVLTCLEVAPTVEPDELYHHYEMQQNGRCLALTIYQYDQDAHMVVTPDGNGTPVVDIWLRDIGEVRCVKDERGEAVLFIPSLDDHRQPNCPWGLSLHIRPAICIITGDAFGFDQGRAIRYP